MHVCVCVFLLMGLCEQDISTSQDWPALATSNLFTNLFTNEFSGQLVKSEKSWHISVSFFLKNRDILQQVPDLSSQYLEPSDSTRKP